MTKFKKPKKKKSLRKKEKLDLNALEAEAKAAGLGVEDLGSRDGRRQVIREEQDRIEAETRSNAFQAALAKADEASKALRQAQVRTMETEEEDAPAFGDDDEELRKSLERARRIALQKQGKDEKSGPMVIKLLASSKANESASENPNASSGDQPESKVVFTEMEEFVWGLQLDEGTIIEFLKFLISSECVILCFGERQDNCLLFLQGFVSYNQKKKLDFSDYISH